jgi:hypothetical protein
VSSKAPLVEQLSDDRSTVVAGRWTDLDVLQNDKVDGGSGYIELASQPKNGQAVVAEGVVRYLAKAGTVGVDSFNYAYVVNNTTRSTARVFVNITAGSCSQNMCGLNRAAGDCDATTGRCLCPAGSQLEPTFIANPSLLTRRSHLRYESRVQTLSTACSYVSQQ